MKLLKTASLLLLTLSMVGMSAVPASASTTVPKKLRGNYYSYQGSHHWAHLSISKHKASMKYPGSKTFHLTPKAKRSAHRLSYKASGKYFMLNSKIKVLADSPFPEGGMKLTSRKIHHKRYKVIRGYQNGYRFDFIKGKKIAHTYDSNS